MQGIDLLRACGGQGGPWELVKELQKHGVDPKIWNHWTKEQQIEYLMFILNEYRKLHKSKVPPEFVRSRDGEFLMRNKTTVAGKPAFSGSAKGAATRSFAKNRGRGRGRGHGASHQATDIAADHESKFSFFIFNSFESCEQ